MLALAMPTLATGLGGLYVAIGAAAAVHVARQGRLSMAAGALVAWPLLLPMWMPGQPAGSGPYAERIAKAFGALAETLADPRVGEVPWDADLTELSAALMRTDERLGLVDRLLLDAPGSAELQTARERTATEIEAVLDEVVQLRVQVGLAALAGDRSAIQARLRDLHQRARALDEVRRIDG